MLGGQFHRKKWHCEHVAFNIEMGKLKNENNKLNLEIRIIHKAHDLMEGMFMTIGDGVGWNKENGMVSSVIEEKAERDTVQEIKLDYRAIEERRKEATIDYITIY